MASTQSPFKVQPHPLKGRAAIAVQDLLADTPLLQTGPPSAYVLRREYRREVCAQCFAYDRGVSWKVRLVHSETRRKQDQSLGLVFCSEACREVWVERHDTIGLEAWAAAWVISGWKNRKSDEVEVYNFLETEKFDGVAKPTVEEIETAWAEVENKLGTKIREIRMRELSDDRKEPTKAEKRLLLRARDVESVPSAEALSLAVSGVLTHYWASNNEGSNDWKSILHLEQDPTPYASHKELKDYINTYQSLLEILPVALLPSLTPRTLHTLQCALSHNAFSIRPPLTSGAYNAELLGWGLWTTGSIWNHSCAPNMAKKMVTNCWIYAVNPGTTVAVGEELCISYLGGDEKEMSVTERRESLKRHWGFECCCKVCMDEAER